MLTVERKLMELFDRKELRLSGREFGVRRFRSILPQDSVGLNPLYPRLLMEGMRECRVWHHGCNSTRTSCPAEIVKVRKRE